MPDLESDQALMQGDKKSLIRYLRKFFHPNFYIELLACFALASCFAVPMAAHSQEIIVNSTVTQETISANTLRAIFGMRLRTWENGSPITVFVLATNHPTHVKFTKDALGVFSYQLERAWDRLVYSGTGQAPIEVFSEREMLMKVATTPGSIGYVKEESIDERVRRLQIL